MPLLRTRKLHPADPGAPRVLLLHGSILQHPDSGESGEAYEIDMTRPGNGPYVTEVYSDGKLHINITVTKEAHDGILESLISHNQNRTEWIRQAIDERLQRERVVKREKREA